MEGDRKAGFSIFWGDDGLDTGPLLLQRETDIDINDTVDSIYSRFLYPEGVRAMVSGWLWGCVRGEGPCNKSASLVWNIYVCVCVECGLKILGNKFAHVQVY